MPRDLEPRAEALAVARQEVRVERSRLHARLALLRQRRPAFDHAHLAAAAHEVLAQVREQRLRIRLLVRVAVHAAERRSRARDIAALVAAAVAIGHLQRVEAEGRVASLRGRVDALKQQQHRVRVLVALVVRRPVVSHRVAVDQPHVVGKGDLVGVLIPLQLATGCAQVHRVGHRIRVAGCHLLAHRLEKPAVALLECQVLQHRSAPEEGTAGQQRRVNVDRRWRQRRWLLLGRASAGGRLVVKRRLIVRHLHVVRHHLGLALAWLGQVVRRHVRGIGRVVVHPAALADRHPASRLRHRVLVAERASVSVRRACGAINEVIIIRLHDRFT